MRFVTAVFAAVLATASDGAAARGIDPGQWQITTTMFSPILPGPQTKTGTQCVTPEDVKNPRRAIDKRLQSDCRAVSLRQSGDTYTWEVFCTQSGMSNKGTIRYGRGTMSGESRTTTNVTGEMLQMITKFSGKRLGPCT